MRNFEKTTMTLFDSTNASFKLAVEAQFVRVNPDQSKRALVYSTERLNALLNPNMYLTFAYKGEELNPVYTSYPQLFRIREAFETIKNYVADQSGFIMADGVLTVRSDCADPVVIANIGKKANWISLKLAVVQSGEEGVLNYVPGVSIELSTSNRYASVLTSEEFLTVYSILKDINLPSLQAMFSLAYLDVDAQPMPAGQFYPQAQPQMPPQNYYRQPQQYNGPQQGGGYRQYNTQPNYQGRQFTRTTTPTPPPPVGNNLAAQHPVENPYPDNTQYMPQQTTTQPMTSNLPPRESKPFMNMKAIEDTPISEIDYDDSSAIDSIFDNSEE